MSLEVSSSSSVLVEERGIAEDNLYVNPNGGTPLPSWLESGFFSREGELFDSLVSGETAGPALAPYIATAIAQNLLA